MPDTGAQSGVRSLLARFENNNQNSPATSPPSRGRSPVPSDTPGSGRPLSKVRASFVAVDRAAQSSPVSGLRKESGRSDSPAIGSEDADAPLRSPVSSPPSNGLDVQKPEHTATATHQVDTEQEKSNEGNHVPKDNTPESPATKEPKPEPNRLAPAAPVEKPKQSPAAKTVTKQPSNARLAQNKPATTTASKTPSTRAKSPAPRTASSIKPAGEKTAKPARQTTTATTRAASNEPARNLTQKPSRTTLNSASKTTTRTSRDNAKSTPSPTVPNSKPARLASSTTAPSLSSAAKTGTARQRGAGTGTNLNRKPSSLKNTTNGNQRVTTPTSSSTRKESSRASLPSQSSNERPGSRVSNTGTKPIDEGFLARMMRPTASSANKVHDKVEAKSPPRSSSRPRVPVQRKATPVTGNRTAHAKGKDESERSQMETPRHEAKDHPKELKDVQSVESAKEEVPEPPAGSLKEYPESTEKATEKTTEEPIEPPSPKEPEEPAVEVAEKASAEPVESPAEPAVQAVEDASVDKPVEPVESTVEHVEKDAAEPAVETGEKTPVESSAEPAEPSIQDSGNVSTVPHEPSAEPQAELVQQPPNAREESAPSAPEEQIPTISEPPSEPAQPSADTSDRPTSIDPKEPIVKDQSGGSSVETSYVDAVGDVATPDPTPDTPDVTGKQESEQPAATTTTTPATAN